MGNHPSVTYVYILQDVPPRSAFEILKQAIISLQPRFTLVDEKTDTMLTADWTSPTCGWIDSIELTFEPSDKNTKLTVCIDVNVITI